MSLPSRAFYFFSHLVFVFMLLLLPPSNAYTRLTHSPSVPQVKASSLIVASPYPLKTTSLDLPILTAKSVIVVDPISAKILFEYQPFTPLAPASLTKIMTALVSLDVFSPDQLLSVPQTTAPPQKVHLLPGEIISVENLLYALLVSSGNDAAQSLSLSHPLGESAFIDQMNQKAAQLHLNSTHFSNSTGLDSPDQYSTALDLARLTAVAIRHPLLSQIFQTPKTTIYSFDQKVEHHLYSTNELLGVVPGVKGVKTGYTQNAGESLITLTQRGDNQIIIVLLGSKNRFQETKELIEWTFNSYQWRLPEELIVE